MKRRNATRNALFTSIISLLLCVSMLVGTTFAWFTDTVESGRNMITAGNLDIKLSTDDGEVDGGTVLFDNIGGDLWEPGVVTYENFTVENVGSLALKYNMSLTVLEETTTEVDGVTYKLGDAIKVGLVDNHVSGDRNTVIAAVSSWTTLSDFALNKNDVKMEAGAEADKFAVVLYWQPDVDYTDGNFDNYFNLNNDRQGDEALKLEIGVNLYATQEEVESDSFDDDYDANAKYSSSVTTISGDGSAILTVAAAPSVADNATTVEAPAGAFEEGDKVEVEVEATNTLFNVNSDGAVVATVDVTMTVNGEETSGDLTDGYYTVTTYIATGLSDVTVAYTGTDGKDQPINVTYNAETGELSFQTNHFSEYAVSGKAYGYDAENDQAYADKAEAAQAAVNGDIEIPVEDLKAVCNALSTSADKNEFKKNNGIAKYGSNVYYLTVDEFVKAFEQESDYTQKIKILRDFNIGNEKIVITNGQKWEIDLNGCTLASSNADTDTHNFMIDVNGGTLTAKNGTIQQQHTGANMKWGGAATVIDVTDGGVLNLEGVTVENLGGTNMNFAVHLNNWGEVTMNADNCVFKAPYCSVRVFNSGPDMNNVKITNSTLTGNKMAFWVHNYDSGDLDPWYYSGGSNGAYDQAKVDARLNLDIYGNNNTFVATATENLYPTPIRYGYNKGVYFSADGAQIVSDASQLATAVAAGGTIILNDNIEVDAVLQISEDTVINGNGKTLTYTGSDRAITVAPVDGAVVDLTISDLTVDCSASYCSRAINYNETGNLVLNNVTVTGAPTYGINLQAMSDGVNVEINGGSYSACIPLNIWGENSVIVANGVDFITVDNADAEGYACIALNNDGKDSANGSVVTINGGSITVTGSNTNGSYAVRNNTATGVINISDSTTVTGETMHAVSVVKYEGTNDFYSHSSLQLSVQCVEKYNSGWIVLLEDISVDSLEVNGDVTIDTNGYTLTVGSYTGDGKLTVDGDVVFTANNL